MKTKVFILIGFFTLTGVFLTTKNSYAAVYYNGYSNPTTTWYGNYNWVGLTFATSTATSSVFSANCNDLLVDDCLWVDVWVKSSDGTSVNAGVQFAHPYPTPSVYDGDVRGTAFDAITTTVGERRKGYMVSAGGTNQILGNVSHMQVYRTNSCVDATSCNKLQTAGGASNTIWGCMADTEAECDAINPANLPNLVFFAFPANSSTIPDFSSWVLNLTNLTTTQTYYLLVEYQNSASQNFVNTIYRDYSSITPTATSSVWTIPKSQSLFNYPNSNVSTSAWNASAYFCTTPTCTAGNIYNRATTTFTVSPNLTSTSSVVVSSTIVGTVEWLAAGAGTSTCAFGTGAYGSVQNCQLTNGFVLNPGQVATDKQEDLITCPSPADWTDVGGGLYYGGCQVLKFAFNPSKSISNFMLAQVNKFTNTFPMSLFYGNTGILIGQLSNNSTTPSTTTYDALVFNQSTTFLGNNPITILTSSSLASVIGTPAKNYLFEIIDYLLQIVFLGLVVGTIWKKFKHHT